MLDSLDKKLFNALSMNNDLYPAKESSNTLVYVFLKT